jgi:hypothetical protein
LAEEGADEETSEAEGEEEDKEAAAENEDLEAQDPNADGTKAKPVPVRKKDKLQEIYTLNAIALNLKAMIEQWMLATFGEIKGPEFEVTDAQAAELRSIIKSHMVQAFRGGYVKVYGTIDPEAVPSPQIVSNFVAAQDPVTDKIIETTNTDINRAITNWTTNGGTIEDFKTQITTSDYIPARSELIAQDRVVVAEGQGEADGAVEVEKTTGKKMGKTWLLSAQPCKICVAIASKQHDKGGIIPIDEPFATAGEFGNTLEIMQRPAHINCGCETIYEEIPEVAP